MQALNQNESELTTDLFVYDLKFNQQAIESNSATRTKAALTIKKEVGKSTTGRTAGYCINYYFGSDSHGWEYIGSDCYATPHVLGDGAGGGYANDPIWEDYPGGSGSNNNPDEVYSDYYAARIQQIRDSVYLVLYNPCIQTMVTKAVYGNLNNQISRIINQVFQNSELLDLSFYEATDL